MFTTWRRSLRRPLIEKNNGENTEACSEEEKRNKEIEKLLLLEDDLVKFVEEQIPNRVVARIQMSLIDSVFSLIRTQLKQEKQISSRRLSSGEKVQLIGNIQSSVNSLISNVLLQISSQVKLSLNTVSNFLTSTKDNDDQGEFDDSSTGNPFDQKRSVSPIRTPVKWSAHNMKSGNILVDMESHTTEK